MTKRKNERESQQAEAPQFRGKKRNPWAVGISIPRIDPLTENQSLFMQYYDQPVPMLGALGCAGTGKTFLAAYKALCDLVDKTSNVRHIKFMRSTVPVRDGGFLPGTQQEKEAPYQIYREIVNNICNRGDAWDLFEQNGFVSFCSTSFEQGKTYPDTIVVLDECQNLSYNELDLVAGRLGEGSRLILCGDVHQCYLGKYETGGLQKWLPIVEYMSSGGVIWYGAEDVVRSGLAREYILAREFVINGIEAEEKEEEPEYDIDYGEPPEEGGHGWVNSLINHFK